MSSAFEFAREHYSSLGVDVERALTTLLGIRVSMHCWQGDDVIGFEGNSDALGGGLAVTGNYPGRARTVHELRADMEFALKLIPGRHKINLHASYGEFPHKIDRDQIEPAHFQGWIDWARKLGLGLDFNPTCFSHPKAADGFTLSHADADIRQFWIEHCKRSRQIAAHFGKALGIPCVNNIWIPDGTKDTPADRLSPRLRLEQSLDLIFADKFDATHLRDAVEPKLFGLGSESYVVGSHDFYFGYAATRQKLLCLDAGHYHPTESIADKITSVLMHAPEILLHLSRGVRWDSDHVVTQTDELLAIVREVVFHQYLNRAHLGLDFFDPSINRVAGWIIGMRNVLRALLIALLEAPAIAEAERAGDLTTRLALQEELKGLPWASVWEEHCRRHAVPEGPSWVKDVKRYEREVLSKRT